jgi:hypothetical protein
MTTTEELIMTLLRQLESCPDHLREYIKAEIKRLGGEA